MSFLKFGDVVFETTGLIMKKDVCDDMDAIVCLNMSGNSYILYESEEERDEAFQGFEEQLIPAMTICEHSDIEFTNDGKVV